MQLAEIIEAISGALVRVTDHADEEAENDSLTLSDVIHSVLHGEIIENYPDDHPYPSCLILGRTSGGDPVHSVWAYNSENRWAVLVTVYRPDPQRWTHWRKRKRKRA